MNATAMLSRMFDRWYRRQIARRQLLDQVRFAGHRADAGARSPAGAVPMHVANHTGDLVCKTRPGAGSRRNG